uniref:Hemerythrin n=1 Tax=Capilloventer sp. Capillo1 TaxID=2032689 RepID=A0A286RT39_9ANNE|nr:hemerythrin [Capilloventer sp. Capillo1]
MSCFAIPDPFVWDETFKVFYDKLDTEHKGLFQGIFNVAANPSDAGALATLKQAVADHFASEEAMMKAGNYPDYTTHKAMHDDFTGTLNKVATPVSNDTIQFAKNWLVNHIKNTDFKYKDKL